MNRVRLAQPTRTNGDAPVDPGELNYQRMKAAIHEELVESLDLSRIGQIGRERMADEVPRLCSQLCRDLGVTVEPAHRERLHRDLLDEVFGLGPLEALMRDPAITEIMVNSAHEVYIERKGRLELSNVVFADDQHVMRIIQRVVGRVGRRVDEVSPMVDARLPDGSRVNAVIPPVALNGPSLSIRRFGTEPLGIDDLIGMGSILPEMVSFLSSAIDSRVSFLISGGTGSGKTTMLNALSEFIPSGERLVTIEDSAELQIRHKHVIRLETRTANTEGAGAITQRDLVRNCLRMRPDRILLGEVRGPEALDMLQAMNTGHEGSLTTIHANDSRDALARLEMMVAMTGFELPVPVVRQYIASGIKLIVHLARLRDGFRCVTRVSEIVGVKDGQFHVEDIFRFDQTGVQDGRIQGHYSVTGYKPSCLSRLKAAGADISDSLFQPRQARPEPAKA